MENLEEKSKQKFMTEYEKERLVESLEQVDFDGDNMVEKVEEELSELESMPEDSFEEEKYEY